MKKKSENGTFRAQYICLVIDALVKQSGYPVATSVLTSTGIASREELRKLERNGTLIGCQVSGERGIANAYYTKEVLPDVVRRRQAEHDKQRIASERLSGGLCTTQDPKAQGDGGEASYRTKDEKDYAEHEYEREGYSQA